jgi:hypothetical protein
LIELVEIYARLEPERVWDGFWCGTPTRFGRLAETGTKRPVEDVLEWQPELAGLSLQEPSQIIINCECGASYPDVKTSARCVRVEAALASSRLVTKPVHIGDCHIR